MFFSKCKDIYNPRAMRVKDTLDDLERLIIHKTDGTFASKSISQTTSEIFADKLRKIRFIFKEWENDIKRTGEKLYR